MTANPYTERTAYAEYLIGAVRHASTSPALQRELSAIYDTPQQPRCMCQPGGIEMYIARYGDQYVVKRAPDSGPSHHPTCTHFEPSTKDSGLAALIGGGLLPSEDGFVIKLGEPLRVLPGRPTPTSVTTSKVPTTKPPPGKRIGLRVLTHLLWQEAGLNRWMPGMRDKRNWGVVRYHLLKAAARIQVSSRQLTEFLYIAKPFSPDAAQTLATERNSWLSSVTRLDPSGTAHKALFIGELKQHTVTEPDDVRLVFKHMPDHALLAPMKIWSRVHKVFKDLFEARAVDERLRMIVTALLTPRPTGAYQTDAISLMLTSEDWLPVDNLVEAAFLRELGSANRAFYRPLSFASLPTSFATAVLLDAGGKPHPLDLVGPFANEKDQHARMRSIAERKSEWIWHVGTDMPELPAKDHRPTHQHTAA